MSKLPQKPHREAARRRRGFADLFEITLSSPQIRSPFILSQPDYPPTKAIALTTDRIITNIDRPS